MTDSVARCSLRELETLLVDPAWADRAGAACLIVELPAGDEPLVVADRLAAVPVPVIGLGDNHGTPAAAAMDVWVADESELAAVVAAIGARPCAAAVLVQVLRSGAGLTVLDALALESLGYATLQGGSEFADWLRHREHRPRKVPAQQDVLQLQRSGESLDIVLNAPHNRNALSVAMRDALSEAFALVAATPELVGVTVRARGPSFSAGGDLTEFGTTSDPSLAHTIRMRRMPARYLAPHGGRYHFRVHGACVGAGIELAAFAGRLTAAEDAFFQLPEVAMGLIPGAGGCVSMPRRIGRQRTASMALTGERVSAQEALAWGLVDDIDG